MLQVRNTHPGDFDFFMIVPSPTSEGHTRSDDLRNQRANELIEQSLSALKAVADRQLADCFAVFTSTCVTWLLDMDQQARNWQNLRLLEEDMKVQIISRLYETPAQVILFKLTLGLAHYHNKDGFRAFAYHACVAHLANCACTSYSFFPPFRISSACIMIYVCSQAHQCLFGCNEIFLLLLAFLSMRAWKAFSSS